MRRRLIICLLAGMLAAVCACKKSQPASPKETTDSVGHVASSNKPINFLHKTFTVKKYAQFEVEVPPHSVIPRIHGTFQSFVPRRGDDNLSDDSPDVRFLVMNADQFSDYANGEGGGTALYTVDSTHDHEVEFVLPPTMDAPEKYYVVFVNAPGGRAVKSVTADFTLSFGY
jgi:hypothetical protein